MEYEGIHLYFLSKYIKKMFSLKCDIYDTTFQRLKIHLKMQVTFIGLNKIKGK